MSSTVPAVPASKSIILISTLFLLLGGALAERALAQIPTPASVIGHRVGADYKLARWAKIVEYFEKLGKASDRVNVRRVGVSTQGKPYLLAEISSPDTMRQLDKYRALQARLHDPRLIRDDIERGEVLRQAKTTIILSCSLHSSEVAAAQMSMELAYDLATGQDARTLEMLDNCIILLVPSANPDGIDKIIDWYEKYVGTPYEGGRMPRLYQKYAGHDNNRDWFMLNLKETRILTHILYHEWRPTILYDIHQMGNRGARFFVPPFFDPINPNVDPLIHQLLVIIGGHMATELQEHGKTGVIYKAIYDNWWAGGNRTTPYRHNIVGILTEAASANIASPVFQKHDQLRGGGRGFPKYAPAVNFPEPWPGGWWRLRDIVEYELIASKALFTLAARYKDHFIRNHLTLSEKALRLGREEPPFAWLVPPDQRDPGAAAHMLEILLLSGIEVHRASQSFKADGVTYPANTFVMLTAQPYRPHLKDMMERQEYPDRRSYPGGPAESPYDVAGWTLPLQMGVKSVEVVSPFDTTMERMAKIEGSDLVSSATALIANPAGYLTRRAGNGDYAAVNALLSEGYTVRVMKEAHGGQPAGSIVVSGKTGAGELGRRVRELTEKHAASFVPLASIPNEKLLSRMTRPRAALYQPWTASMDEGWTRWVLEQFGFPHTTIHNAEIRAGNLRDRYDCIIIPDLSLSSILNGASDKRMPPPYAGGIGDDGAMELERFARAGGTLVLMDSASQMATDLYRLPLRNVLAGLGRDKFICPGSILRIRVDNSHPLGYGFGDEAAAFFARSQAFVTGKPALKKPEADKGKSDGSTEPARISDTEITARLEAQPVASAATYSENIVLLSGWIQGEEWLRGKAAVCEVKVGDGRVVCFGFRVQHRGQPHGTFKFLFNAIYRSTLEENVE